MRQVLQKLRGAPCSTTLIFFFLSLVVAVATIEHDASRYFTNPDMNIEPDRPLLRNYDGWLYLRFAKELQACAYVQHDALRRRDRPQPPPLLSILAGKASAFSGISLERAAVLLPPLLALSLPLLLLPAAAPLRAGPAAGAACLAAVSVPYWYTRTNVGFYDTDCLIPSFLLVLCVCVYWAAFGRKKQKTAAGIVFLAAALLFLWWWRFAAVFSIALAAAAYCATVIFPSSRLERLAKLAAIGGAGLCAIYVGLVFSGTLPTPEKGLLHELFNHIRLALGIQGQEQADVGATVMELGRLGFGEYIASLSAFAPTVLLAGIGLVLLCVKSIRFAVCMLPFFVFLAASFTSDRFLVFATVPYALGFGFFLRDAAEMFAKKVPKAAVYALGAALLLPSLHENYDRFESLPLTAAEARLAQAAGEAAGPGQAVWCWWDYGYFVQYFAGAFTPADGGRIMPFELEALSAPLTMNSTAAGARALKFFDTNKDTGAAWLEKHITPPDRIAPVFRALMEDPKSLQHSTQGEFKLPASKAAKTLYPKKDIVVFLNSAVLDLTARWMYFGEWALGKTPKSVMELGIVVDRRALGDIDVDQGAGVLRDARGGLPVREIAVLTDDGIMRKGYRNASRFIAVVHMPREFVYIVDEKVYNTLPWRLFFRAKENAEGFTPVAFDPKYGGVWKTTALPGDP